jgi:hypothetical protein
MRPPARREGRRTRSVRTRSMAIGSDGRILRVLFVFFLLAVILEGALRKWAFPEYGVAIFVAKDVILIAAAISYLGSPSWRLPRSPDLLVWPLWIAITIGYAIAVEFSFQSVVGLRYYLAPLPLVLLVPKLVRDTSDLRWIARWAVVTSIAVCVLGVVQYLSPLDSALNIYARPSESDPAGFGITLNDEFSGLWRPRVTGTFSYISTYAAYLAAVWLLAWLSLLHARSAIERWLAGIALVLIAFNIAMTGSRAVMLASVVVGIPYAVALVRRIGGIKMQLAAVAAVIVVSYVGVSAFEPFVLTANRADEAEATERVLGQALMPLNTLSEVDLVGKGIGATFGGYQLVGVRAAPGFDEVNLDRMGIEMGVIGYVVLLAIKLLMALKALLVWNSARNSEMRHWALAALLVQLSALWQIPFYNSVAASAYFCAIGVVYWIEEEQKRLRATTARRFEQHRRALNPPSPAWR